MSLNLRVEALALLAAVCWAPPAVAQDVSDILNRFVRLQTGGKDHPSFRQD
jgi:hypothetical protein